MGKHLAVALSESRFRFPVSQIWVNLGWVDKLCFSRRWCVSKVFMGYPRLAMACVFVPCQKKHELYHTNYNSNYITWIYTLYILYHTHTNYGHWERRNVGRTNRQFDGGGNFQWFTRRSRTNPSLDCCFWMSPILRRIAVFECPQLFDGIFISSKCDGIWCSKLISMV